MLKIYQVSATSSKVKKHSVLDNKYFGEAFAVLLNQRFGSDALLSVVKLRIFEDKSMKRCPPIKLVCRRKINDVNT